MAVPLFLVGSDDLAVSAAESQLHRHLAGRNSLRLTPMLQTGGPPIGDPRREAEDLSREQDFLVQEQRATGSMLRDLPVAPDDFVAWFEALRERGPGQHDPLFPWLAESCTREQMRWFLGQEVAGEAGFEDLLALTQLKMPVQAKLEMARNFWDEMGRGQEAAMHGPLLNRLASALDVSLPVEEIVWESLALGNLMVALACNRAYAYQAIGALGVIELTAPGRAHHVNAGLRRLGVSAHDRQYFAIHATLDVKHARAWNREVIRPLVAEDPRVALPIAQGALMRLRAGARCFAAYRACHCLPPSAVKANRTTVGSVHPGR